MKTCSFILLLLSLIACKQDSILPPLVTDRILAIQKQYAPDRRVALFDIQPTIQDGIIILKGETTIPNAKEELLQALVSVSPLDSIQLLPNSTLEGKVYGVVTIPVANMRSKPAHSSELSNQMLCGTVLRLYKIQAGWVFCQTPDDYLGWIDQEAILKMDSIEADAWWAKPKIIVTSHQAMIQESPTKQSQVISMVPPGAILESSMDFKNYYAVSFADGRSGFLPADQGSDFDLWKLKQAKSPTPEAIIHTASMFKGTSYLWGGTSTNGLDCSGFTKMVFLQHGLLLPRDASQQVKVGETIVTDTTLKNLLPGDFLFFGKKLTDSTAEKITHVAIYIGNAKIIHASGYVRIQSLRRGDPDFAENRLMSLVRATRPLTSPDTHGIPFLNEISFFK